MKAARPATNMGFTMTRDHVRVAGGRWLAGALLLLIANLAAAAAGKVLFVSGEVRVERAGVQALRPGDVLEVGDVVVTGAQARAQLLMADGAKIALRAGSRLRIDALTLPAAVSAPGQATAVAKDGSSIATLLKGGFRTATGSIGKADPAAYAVRTPVGVLGIRGTDYTAVFCQGDCSDAPGVRPGEAIRDGLYLGVTAGRIAFQVAGGAQIHVEAGEFVLIPVGTPVPEPLPGPPAFLLEDGAGRLEIGQSPAGAADGTGFTDFGNRRVPRDEGPAPGPGDIPGGEPTLNQPIEGTDGQGRPVDITGGNVPGGQQGRDASFAIGSLGPAPVFGAVAAEAPGDYGLDRSGGLTAFRAPFPAAGLPLLGEYQLGSAANAESGTDPATQLRWGRWTGGTAQAVVAGIPQPLDLANRSLHWALSGEAATPPALPQSGSASYTLVGNTNPTDNLGAVGTLGGASFDADFTNSIVASTLDLQVNGVQWNATGTGTIGAQAGLPAHQFSGGYTAVVTGGQAPGGTGSFTGFFSTPGGSQPGVPGDAGLTYTLIDDAGLQSVQGAAAFAAP